MSTHDDARLAAIRERLNGYGNGYWERTYGHETVMFAMDIRKLLTDGAELLAEFDRLTREIDPELREANNRFTSALVEETSRLRTELAALRAAHTWTVATPATMPPVGSGPWLVEMWSHQDKSDAHISVGWSPHTPGEYGWWSPSSDCQTKSRWPHSRFAAVPAEPAKEPPCSD